MNRSHAQCLVLLACSGCGAIGPDTELIACSGDLDCYVLSADNPLGCFRCDPTQAGGACVRLGDMAPTRDLDVYLNGGTSLRSYGMPGALTLVGEREPGRGNSVSDEAFAMHLDRDAAATPVTLVTSAGVTVSQLAVAGRAGHAWCLAIDHKDASDGHLCIAPCDAAACTRLCTECTQPRWPSLAVTDCTEDGSSCAKLAAFIDAASMTVAGELITKEGVAHSLPLPASLDPACAPLALRVARGGEARFVIATGKIDLAAPWWALVASDPNAPLRPAPQGDAARVEGARIHSLAGAAPEGHDAEGAFLLAWVEQVRGESHLRVAHGAWAGAQRFAPLEVVFSRLLAGKGQSVSVAYARYGRAPRSNGLGPGGWTVTWRDGARAWGLRIDRERVTGPHRAQRVVAADGRHLTVAPHPGGNDAPAPFLYADLSEDGSSARMFECSR